MPIYVVKRGRRRKKKKPRFGVRPKQIADRLHAKNRLKQRYGVDMNRETRLAIELAINSKQAKPSDFGYSTKTRGVYENVVPGHPEIPIVFSHKTNSPVTSLERKKKTKDSDVR